MYLTLFTRFLNLSSDASYVGQTKRKLNTSVCEHRKDINKKTSNHSVIMDHRLKFNHDFDWDNPLILDKEKHYYKKLILEMMNIKAQKIQLICNPIQRNMYILTF